MTHGVRAQRFRRLRRGPGRQDWGDRADWFAVAPEKQRAIIAAFEPATAAARPRLRS